MVCTNSVSLRTSYYEQGARYLLLHPPAQIFDSVTAVGAEAMLTEEGCAATSNTPRLTSPPIKHSTRVRGLDGPRPCNRLMMEPTHGTMWASLPWSH